MWITVILVSILVSVTVTDTIRHKYFEYFCFVSILRNFQRHFESNDLHNGTESLNPVLKMTFSVLKGIAQNLHSLDE